VIDVHCHILPELDDGARSLADSIDMARQAVADGIDVVCATPHIRYDHRVEILEIAPRVAILQQELDRLDIPLRLAPGGELAASAADAIDDDQLQHVTLGGTGGWVLLEPGPGPIGAEFTSVVDRLVPRGVAIVVAHPERHAGPDFVEYLQELEQKGCVLQWTAEFVARAYDADLVLRLAGDGLVHVLGSDAHSSLAGRPVRLGAAYARLQSVCTAAQLHWMTETAPQALIHGEPLTLRSDLA
jgi:protein-tyrosine phosphatase